MSHIASKQFLAAAATLFVSSLSSIAAEPNSVQMQQYKNETTPLALQHGGRFYFRDDKLKHLIGIIDVRLVDGRLKVEVLAQHPLLEGTQGFEHLDGGNSLTARVLQEMADKRYPCELISNDKKPQVLEAQAEQGLFLKRSIRTNGSINFLDFSRRCSRLHFNTEKLAKGKHQLLLRLSNELRFRISFEVKQSQSLTTKLIASSKIALEFAPQAPTSAAPKQVAPIAKGEIKIANWKELSEDKKYQTIEDFAKKDAAGLTDFLFDKKEYLLLEAWALSRKNGFTEYEIGDRLIAANAPNSMRFLSFTLSHNKEHLNATAPKALQQNRQVYDKWAKGEEKLLLPAYDLKQWLKTLQDLAKSNTPTNKAVRHKFLIRRSYSWKLSPKITTAVYQLALSQNKTLREEALLALTSLPLSEEQHSQLHKLSLNNKLSLNYRQKALLASSSRHNSSYFHLLSALQDKVLRPVALSQLHSHGEGFALETLLLFDRQQLTAEELQILQATINQLQTQQAAIDLSLKESAKMANDLSLKGADNIIAKEAPIRYDCNRSISLLQQALRDKSEQLPLMRQFLLKEVKRRQLLNAVTKDLYLKQIQVQTKNSPEEIDWWKQLVLEINAIP